MKDTTLAENNRMEKKVQKDDLPTDINELVLESWSEDDILKYACKTSKVEVKKSEIPGLENEEGLFVAK